MSRYRQSFSEALEEVYMEKIQPFMISYSDRYGKHAGFEGGDSLQDIQNKAANLRKRGFKIDKMGRYNPPVGRKEDAFDVKTEACWTGYKQVGMKNKGGKQVPNCVPEDFKVEEYITEEEDESKKLKNQLDQKDNEIAQLKQKEKVDKAKNLQQRAQANINPETGEPLLQVGIAYKHLKDKMKKEAEKAKQKENSQKIADLATVKKDLEESKASDKAKGMGLDYMKFGRYGKDGKVTHKTSGDNLVKVGKNDEPTDDKPAKKPDAPKKDKDTGEDKEADIKIKSRNFIKDLFDGKLETKDGDTIEPDFDFEDSWDDAIEKAKEMGLPELADEIESIAGYVMEMEPENAQAEYQDMLSKYSGKPVKSLEFAKKADEAIDLFTDSANADIKV